MRRSVKHSLFFASLTSIALGTGCLASARAGESSSTQETNAQKSIEKTTSDQSQKQVIGQRTGWYGTLALGAIQPQDQTAYVLTHYGYDIRGSVSREVGFSGETGIGYDFGSIRTELTYGYAKNNLSSSQATAMGISEKTANLLGSTTTNRFLGSAYWDINTHSRFTPYIGGGIGYGLIHQSATTFQMNYGSGYGQSGNYNVLAYQGKIGVGYMTSKNLEFFFEGVYEGSTGYDGESGFTPNSSTNGTSNAWGANVGFRYRL